MTLVMVCQELEVHLVKWEVVAEWHILHSCFFYCPVVCWRSLRARERESWCRQCVVRSYLFVMVYVCQMTEILEPG